MKYDLVFEGGGAKGMIFVGACKELFDRGHSFGRLLGTSAGAITATLLAAGYSSQEMLEALVEKGSDGKSLFTGFMGPPAAFTQQELAASATQRLLDGVDFTFLPDFIERKSHTMILQALAGGDTFRHVLSLIERGGWFAADRFVTWLSTKLSSGTFQGAKRQFSNMSFEEFFEATGVELSLVASDTSDGNMLVLNHHTAPDCPIVWAVRMSMSIPLVWEEVIWKDGWGKYQGNSLTGHAIVDGGVLSNFPIELFISDAPQVMKLMGEKTNNTILGMLIDERLEPPAKALVRVNVKLGELATIQRLQRLVDTATGAHDKMVIDEYNHLVVRLPAKGYGTTEFDMSEERRNALVAAGRDAMAAYLDTPAGLSGLVLPSKAMPGGMKPQTAADRIAGSMLSPGPANQGASP